MPLNTNNLPHKDSTPKQITDQGTYPARIVQLIDLGLQEQRLFKGEAKPDAYEILVTYELVDEFMKDEDGNDILDKPRWISERFPVYPLKVERATSTSRYKAIDPSEVFEGDWAKLITAPVNVTIVHNAGKGKHQGKVFENVGALSAMRAKDAENCPPLVNPTKVFDLTYPNMEVFAALPEWMQELIKGNKEFKESALEQALSGGGATDTEAAYDDDEIPF